ncbi:MAG TPA: hypothetical protein VH583_22015 [Vicinamibacterales bacterium]|jgi:hypothetical protein
MNTRHLPPPTHEDAKLLLQLYEMRREPRLREARQWFAASFRAKSFEELMKLCPPGSEQNASYRMVTSYWELVASLIATGVLSQELFFQTGRELLLCWMRIRDVAPHVRTHYRNPIEWKNLEIVAHAYVEWWNTNAPGAYDAFCERNK